MSTAARAPRAPRPPLWRDVRVLRLAFQVLFLGAVAALLLYLYTTGLGNLRRLGIPTGFGFLQQPAGFRIAGSDFRPSQTVFDAVFVGVRNTVLVSALGIALATVLGILIGIARLSANWIVRRAAAVYVESLRNIPVLIIILFFYLAVFLRLPPIGEAVEWADVLVLSNRGLVVPWLDATAGTALFLVLLLVAAAVAAAVVVWRTRVFDLTGRPHRRVLWGAGTFVVLGAVAYVAGGAPLALSLPERGDLGTEHGLALSPEYGALLAGLTLYTASHIAEIVRGSLLAVPRGQTEAANALALSGVQRLRFVILPQAFRIMIPPLANQFLNLTKNSSLGVAVAFPEVTRIMRIAIGQAAPAPQSVAVLMLVYLTLSLIISLVANLVNWRVTLRGAG
jgi:general L-amino acid transport system permease protein